MADLSSDQLLQDVCCQCLMRSRESIPAPVLVEQGLVEQDPERGAIHRRPGH